MEQAKAELATHTARISGPTNDQDSTGAGTIAAAVRAALWESRVFLVVILAQLVVGAIMAGASHRLLMVNPLDSYDAFFTAAAGFGAMAFLIVLFRERLGLPGDLPPAKAYRAAWTSLRKKHLTPFYFANTLIALCAAPFAMSVFSAAKQTIPALHPFSWDARIAQLGMRLHNGQHMYRWLEPIVWHPMITVALDKYYHIFWPSLMVGTFVVAALMPAGELRRRYIVAAPLVFLLVGNIAALILSSAGPAFYGNVAGGSVDPYGPLMRYLHSVDARYGLISATDQRNLWSAYMLGLEGFGGGISAMPSVHIASATLCALFGAAIDKRLGIVLGLAVIIMFIGSVSLGWHYALDGYVGAALAYLVWVAARWMTRGQARETRRAVG